MYKQSLQRRYTVQNSTRCFSVSAPKGQRPRSLYNQNKQQEAAGETPAAGSSPQPVPLETADSVTYKDLWSIYSKLFTTDGKKELLNQRNLKRLESKVKTQPQQRSQLYQNKTDRIEYLKSLTDSSTMKGSVMASAASANSSTKKSGKPTMGSDSILTFLDHPEKPSPVLYLNCGAHSLTKADILTLLPPAPGPGFQGESTLLLGAEVSGTEAAADMYRFKLTRSRDPDTLIPWVGYFLEFPTREAAAKFYTAALGQRLRGTGGLVRLTFVDPGKRGARPPRLHEVPGVTRAMCALVAGLPPKLSPVSVERALMGFDLLKDKSEAIVKLAGDAYASESLWLIRFQSEEGPKRLRRQFHRRPWPLINASPSVEIID